MSGAFIALAVYFVLNVISFSAYGWDKHKAVRGQWRTKERTLLILGLIGPWGAVAGMSMFHHKTQKPKFKLNYVFLALHALAIVLLVYGTLAH
ncbi:MAG: DUF1294 domain-containing protein [archaeon]|nr:DUF1294 domain-containing protein [archaeon]